MLSENDVQALMDTLRRARPVAEDGADPQQKQEARATMCAVSAQVAEYYRPRCTDKQLPPVDRDAAKLMLRLMEKDMARYAPEAR